MGKKLICLAAMLAAVMVLLCCALAETSGDYTYALQDDGACITGYVGSETALTLPAALDGVPVTAIGYHAFYQAALTSVVVPEGVTSIGKAAFEDCASLIRATLPGSLVSIGERAFYQAALTSVVVPEGVTAIGSAAFCKCAGLTSVALPDSLVSIGDSAFYNCSALTRLDLPEGVSSIGSHAFNGCPAAIHVRRETVGARALGRAGYYPFVDDALPSLRLWHAYYDNRDQGLRVVGADADVAEVVVPEGVVAISSNAFQDCAAWSPSPCRTASPGSRVMPLPGAPA